MIESTGYCTCQASTTERWLMWAFWIGLVLFWIASFVQLKWEPLSESSADVTRFVMLGLLFATGVANWFIYYRIRRTVSSAGLLPCPRCRHPVLTDSEPDYIRCPECGYRNQTNLVRQAWAARYRIKTDHLRTADEGDRYQS